MSKFITENLKMATFSNRLPARPSLRTKQFCDGGLSIKKCFGASYMWLVVVFFQYFEQIPTKRQYQYCPFKDLIYRMSFQGS